MEVKVKAATAISTKTDDETKKMKDEEEDQKIIKHQEEDSLKKITETQPHDSIMKMLQNDKSCNKSQENTKKEEENNNVINNKKKTSSLVWDCGSSLYDSFELNSFKRQLDSAISASSARSMSMSRLPDRRVFSPAIPDPPPQSQTTSSKKQSNKISRSLQRMLKSVFRSKSHHHTSSASSSPTHTRGGDNDMARYYVVYDTMGSLTTIPESTEKEVGPEINSLVRKTVSERFPAARVVGISCA